MDSKKFISARMRIEPLMPHKLAPYASIQKALKIARRDLMRRIKRKLTKTPFSKRAKAAFHKAVRIETKPASLVVKVNHPAFWPLVRGQRRGQMNWLKRARRPIPIITETGELIFRSAHARSLTWKHGPMTGPNVGKQKGWLHPGREKADFVEQSKQEAREFLREKFKDVFRQELRKMKTKKRK